MYVPYSSDRNVFSYHNLGTGTTSRNGEIGNRAFSAQVHFFRLLNVNIMQIHLTSDFFNSTSFTAALALAIYYCGSQMSAPLIT